MGVVKQPSSAKGGLADQEASRPSAEANVHEWRRGNFGLPDGAAVVAGVSVAAAAHDEVRGAFATDQSGPPG